MNDKTGIRDNKGCVSSEVHLSFVCPGHMGDLDLPFLRLLVAIILFCSFECPVDAQPAGWKLLHLSKATVNYPANWEAQGSVCGAT